MACSEKAKERSRRWYWAHREVVIAKKREYYQKNKEVHMKRMKAWKDKNREHVRAIGRKDAKKYLNLEAVRLWRAKNAEKIREMERERSKTESYKVSNAIKSATRRRSKCAWANEDKVKSVYREALRLTKETGIRHVVDHVIPIKHRLVCGLHNEFNLAVLTQHENSVKKNRFHVGIV